MIKRQWKYRFYEEEELDIDDILDDTDHTDDTYSSEDFSTNDDDISSQIKSLVSKEVKRLTTDNSKETRDSSMEKTATTEEKEESPAIKPKPAPQKQDQTPARTELRDTRKHTPVPHHSNPVYPSTRHSKSPHRRRGQLSNKRTNPKRKTRPTKRYHVVYQSLETINTYPNNRSTLLRFNQKIKGNFIIFSPITSKEDNPNIQMHDLFSFRQMCISQNHRYFPIYTYDNGKKLIDISLCVFPHNESKEEFKKLTDMVLKSGMGNGDYVGCEKGSITLWIPSPLHYTENNLNRVMDHYIRDRGIFVGNGSRHFINPVPQSRDEITYRTAMGELFLSPNTSDHPNTISNTLCLQNEKKIQP